MSPRSLSDIYTVHTTTEQMEQVQAWAVKGAPAGCMAKKGLRKGVHATARPLGERTKRKARAKRAASKPHGRAATAAVAMVAVASVGAMVVAVALATAVVNILKAQPTPGQPT